MKISPIKCITRLKGSIIKVNSLLQLKQINFLLIKVNQFPFNQSKLTLAHQQISLSQLAMLAQLANQLCQLLVKILNRNSMTQQHVETTTILSDGNTIIIAHPHPKPQTTLWDTFTGFFASNQPSSTPTTSQPITLLPVEQHILQAVPVSLEIKPAETVVEILAVEAVPVIEDTSSWTDCFSAENIANYRSAVKEQIKSLQGADQRLSRGITQFKEQKLLSLGDVRVRSILMSFSSAVMYKLISINTGGFLRKTRNLGASFVFMGYWFVPELFNPFVRRPSLAQNIV